MTAPFPRPSRPRRRSAPRKALLLVPAAAACLVMATLPVSASPAGAALTPARGAGVMAQAGSDGEMTPAKPGQRITFYVAMRRDESGARRALQRVSDPTSPKYRRFLTRAQARERFGASAADVRVVTRSAERARLTATMDPTGLFVRVTGAVSDLERWTGAPIQSVTLPMVESDRAYSVSTIYFSEDGQLPDRVAKVAEGLVPLYVKTVSVTAVNTRVRPVPGNTGTYIGGCKQAKRQNTYSFDQLAEAYGTTALSHSRATGKATRLAIIAAGSGFSQRALNQSADCFDVPGRTFVRVHADGMIGNLPESDEGDLDTQMAQAVLPPGSTATVIETAPIAGTWFIPWAAAFGLERRPDAVTMSYGLCEPSTGDFFLARPMRRLLDSALVRLGLVGTTAAASSGDDGSSDCVESAGGATPESVAPAVDYPGSSPYITSVGGSRIVLRRNNSRRTEVTWRDVDRTMVVNGETVAAPTSGGGGGVSVLYDQPWWQADAGIRHRGRTTPDIAMHASFGPGWPVFITGAGQRASASSAPGGFYAIAGTSASSPFFASNVAVFAAMQRRAGEPAFGHIAPALYDAALRSPKAVYDITRTSNDLYGVGCCEAKKGYDLASGFGAPNFDVFPWLLPPVGGR